MKNKFLTKSSLLASTFLVTGAMVTGSAHAQDQAQADSGNTDVITVTATKRASDLQDVAISVNVLGNQQMEDLNVNGFDDYIHFLPTVSFESSGQGSALLYMRGIASGGDGNHSASMPSVGVYLDEQPITTIGQVLDLHMYDIARVETLSGPQGTLFGASSQAGTMRIITNKPVIGEFEAGYDLAIDTVKDGEMGGTVEGFANLPIADNMALRVVGWFEEDGGYIDNVPHTINFGLGGFTETNAEFVEDDYNNITTKGTRIQLGIDLNENWLITPGITYQEQSSNGSFTPNSDLFGDLNRASFHPEIYEDSWYQATITVEGNIGDYLELVYAGAYLDRNTDSSGDYIGYAEYWDLIGQANGWGCVYYKADGVTCANPDQFTTFDDKYTRQSHEIRVTTPAEYSFRAIGGLFYQHQKHDFDYQWVVPDMNPEDSVIENGTTVWQTKQVREDRDWAAFGEIEYDLTDRLTAMAGIRFYKYRNSLYGFNGWLPHCVGFTVNGEFTADPDGTPQYPCFDTRILDDEQKDTGHIFKFNVSYEFSDDFMGYATFSQGFRAGGVNRARVPNIPGYQPDFIDNYEIGWKAQMMDNRVRFNGALYYIKWKDVQTSFLDFAVSPLTIIQNVGGSRTYGGEFDLTIDATDDLRLSFSASYNDAKLTAPYSRSEGGDILAPTGTRMPFVPKLQFTGIARQNFQVSELPAFAQVAVKYTGMSYNELDVTERLMQDSYTMVNASIGIEKDDMTFTIFADNLLDTRAIIARYVAGYDNNLDSSEGINRPRTFGVRFGQRF